MQLYTSGHVIEVQNNKIIIMMMKKSTLIAVFALLWFSAIVHGQETETRDLPSFNRLSVGVLKRPEFLQAKNLAECVVDGIHGLLRILECGYLNLSSGHHTCPWPQQPKIFR